MTTQTKLKNALAIRAFLSLVGGVILCQVGKSLGEAENSSHTFNWYFIASCVIYALVPIGILRTIQRSQYFFSKWSYPVTLSVATLLALGLGLAFSFGLLYIPPP
ncbi:hypothetical protein A6R71_14550 [Xanthomonas translucens pv. arrhenatheri]|uniref:hypothetical protein n=1 Tax=Xanthomonas graminis TaxID=3390026 RepID=UPI0007FD92D1|nr:hypothetical protein [Xanthomonas translucens]OAX63528.1 hypothetical protein A6R71_14550 [Xanthomonas translucens pv. arrhenatheri]UKE78553.1 hypothetical protein KM317_04805 [Xanthomonas translucens pv. arrhenatheri]